MEACDAGYIKRSQPQALKASTEKYLWCTSYLPKWCTLIYRSGALLFTEMVRCNLVIRAPWIIFNTQLLKGATDTFIKVVCNATKQLADINNQSNGQIKIL